MAKYGFAKLGMYDKLWSSSDKKFLQVFIDNAALLQVNYRFVYDHFKLGAMSLPTDATGAAVYRVGCRTSRPDEMADFRAPLSNTSQMDRSGFTTHTGTIPELGKGFMETAQERYQKERIVEQFGNDAIDTQLISGYITELQSLKNTIDSRLSYMAAQRMTTGNVKGFNADDETNLWYHDEQPIPKENFVGAGERVWTDKDADLIAQMQKIENDFRYRTGYEGTMQWNITLNMWRNVFLKNAKLRDNVMNYRKIAEKPYDMNGSMSEDWLNEYLNAMGLLSPIKVMQEGAELAGITTRKNVRGWADNIAVLRPAGYAGEIQYTGTLDKVFADRFKSPVAERITATLDGGLMTLINFTADNAGLPVYHTDLFCAAVPVLTEWPYHVIVDTSVAGGTITT